MKSILLVLLLSGCSFIMPIPHDPVMFGNLVDVQIGVDKLSCTDKDWNSTLTTVNRLKVYSKLRNDPQAETVSKLSEALEKAKESKNQTFCESVLKINKTRIDVITKAWSGR